MHLNFLALVLSHADLLFGYAWLFLFLRGSIVVGGGDHSVAFVEQFAVDSIL